MLEQKKQVFVETPEGELPFQTWFVGRRHADPVTAVRYEGAEAARPAPGVLEALEAAELVFLAPSNPFTSVLPILEAVQDRRRLMAHDRGAAQARHGGLHQEPMALLG